MGVIGARAILQTLALSVLAATAAADERVAGPASSDRVVYDAAFYAAFAPRTALDMIEQTPGFVLQDSGSGEERRGFSGAVGNVLIDGERLSAKSQSLSDVLRRVPFAEVLRIEILRGSSVAGDASGAAVLANVVRTNSAGSGTWEAGAEVTNEHEPRPVGSFGWSGRSETIEYSLGGNVYAHKHESTGERSVRDGAGTLVAQRHDVNPHENEDLTVNGQVSSPWATGKVTVTGQFSQSQFESKATLLTTAPGGAQIENELNPAFERERNGETGLTYERAFSTWAMELVALATREWQRAEVSSTTFDAANQQDSVFRQRVDQDSGETIVRATFARGVTQGRLEVGAEGAFNTLDGELELTADVGAGPVPLDIPNANLRVEESRAEAFVSHVWNASERWSLDSRLAAETSRLQFTGDTEQSVSLMYVKPRVQLTRKLGAHQLQARVFRDVSQLDFSDFVSSAQLEDDLIEGGNPDLRPQTAWALEFDSDFRFPNNAALRARLFHHWLDDVVDLVPVGPPGNQIDAAGNIGEGTLAGVELSLQLPLSELLPGGTFNLSATWQDSRVRDPVTQEWRDISDLPEQMIEIELRQDLVAQKLAWGMTFETSSAESDYRLAEIDTFHAPRRLDAFIETSVFATVKVRLSVFSILDDKEGRDRQFYDPDRTGVLVLRETSRFEPGYWWMLQASGSF
jgi:hypothetical protein